VAPLSGAGKGAIVPMDRLTGMKKAEKPRLAGPPRVLAAVDGLGELLNVGRASRESLRPAWSITTAGSFSLNDSTSLASAICCLARRRKPKIVKPQRRRNRAMPPTMPPIRPAWEEGLEKDEVELSVVPLPEDMDDVIADDEGAKECECEGRL
jgi:hypothetical protein